MADLFGGTLPIDHAAQLKELDREIVLRERVYPEWVKSGSLTQVTATRQLAVLRAVRLSMHDLADLRKKVADEHRQGMHHAAAIVASAAMPEAAATIRRAIAGPLRCDGAA